MSKSTERPFGTAVRIFASVAFAFMLLAGATLMMRPATGTVRRRWLETAAGWTIVLTTWSQSLLGSEQVRRASRSAPLASPRPAAVIEVFASRDGAPRVALAPDHCDRS